MNTTETTPPGSLHPVVVPLDEIPWHPAMQSVIEWRNKLNLSPDDPERDSLERLLSQLDGRVRHLELRAKRHNDPN